MLNIFQRVSRILTKLDVFVEYERKGESAVMIKMDHGLVRSPKYYFIETTMNNNFKSVY